MRCVHLEQWFENLGEHDYCHQRVSPATPDYNCIAWAGYDQTRCWWPIDLGGYWWPPNLPKEETVQNFIDAYATIGYLKCTGPELEPGIEKVAIFVDDKNVPTHAARQLVNGTWASKCGDFEDIEHKTLQSMEGKQYGTVHTYLKRWR